MQPNNPYGENPYAPPSIAGSAYPPVFAPQGPGPLQPASGWRRFFNLFIDSIVTNVLSSGAGFVVGIVYALNRANPRVPISPDEEFSLRLFGGLVGIMIVLAYYLITEGIWQRSLAKFVTGTRVVTVDGGCQTFGQILGRTFARMIPFEAFSFFGGNGYPVGWHDSLSGTRVVKVR